MFLDIDYSVPSESIRYVLTVQSCFQYSHVGMVIGERLTTCRIEVYVIELEPY